MVNKLKVYNKVKGKVIRHKVLLPSLKEKKRYVSFEVISVNKCVSFGDGVVQGEGVDVDGEGIVKCEGVVKYNEIVEMIDVSFEELVGKLGAGKAGLMFLRDWKTDIVKGVVAPNGYSRSRGIVRVNAKSVDYVKASFVNIRKEGIMLKSLGVSGTLKQIRSKI